MYLQSQRWMLIINNRFLSLYDYNFLLVNQKLEKIFLQKPNKSYTGHEISKLWNERLPKEKKQRGGWQNRRWNNCCWIMRKPSWTWAWISKVLLEEMLELEDNPLLTKKSFWFHILLSCALFYRVNGI